MSTRLPSRSLRRRASLAVVVVLPEPCRPTMRIGAGGAVDAEVAGLALAAEHVDERVVDDLDDLLAGGDGLGDGLALGLVGDCLDEVAGDGEGDVGFEQRGADLAEGGGDVLVGEGALAGERAEDAGEPVGKGLEHRAAALLENDDRAGGRYALTGGDPEGQDRRVRDSPGTAGDLGEEEAGQPRIGQRQAGASRRPYAWNESARIFKNNAGFPPPRLSVLPDR